ncbi:MAG TPA: hypothetical protein VGM75_27655 [Pseudonocardiaceae bacterium]
MTTELVAARAEGQAVPTGGWHRLTDARSLRIALGLLWLLDTVLQSQPVMFSSDFTPDNIQIAAQGNPSFVAGPMFWVADQILRLPFLANLGFVVVQLVLALGLFIRRTNKIALVATVVWSLGVWWFGEGFGGILNGTANPLMGAPGAAALYVLLAIVLWPRAESSTLPARLIWFVSWGSLAGFALTPANRAPNGVAGMVAGMADGEPGWLAALDHGVVSGLAGRGSAIAVVLAVVFAALAIAGLLPDPVRRVATVAALVVALLIWVVGENFGAILAGQATDPNTGPLLALLALACWPPSRRLR